MTLSCPLSGFDAASGCLGLIGATMTRMGFGGIGKYRYTRNSKDKRLWVLRLLS